MSVSRGRKLMKNTVILSIGKICTSMITFLLLPLYTGILSTEEYGIVDLLNTLMALLLPLIGLQVEKGVFRELIEARQNKKTIERIITTGFVSLMLQCLFSIPFFAIVSLFIHNDYQYFLLLNVLAFVIVSFMQQVARGLDEMTKYAVGSFINAVGTIVFNVLFLVVFKFGAYGMLLGTFCGFAASFIYYIYSLRFFSYFRLGSFKSGVLKTILRYSLPLVPNTLAWWVFSASDRIIVSFVLGLDSNGTLAAAMKFSTIITTLYNIFDTSWIESVSLAIKDKDVANYFNRVANVIIKLFASLGLVIVTLMPFVFPILINEKFAESYYLIPIAIMSSVFNVLQGLVAVIYAAKRNTKSIAKTSLTAAVANVIVHLALIRTLGLYAAVISTLVAFFVLGVYRVIDTSRKYFRVDIDKKFIVLLSLVTAFALLTYYINNAYSNVLSIILAIMFAVLVNKKSFVFIKNTIANKLFRKEKR